MFLKKQKDPTTKIFDESKTKRYYSIIFAEAQEIIHQKSASPDCEVELLKKSDPFRWSVPVSDDKCAATMPTSSAQ